MSFIRISALVISLSLVLSACSGIGKRINEGIARHAAADRSKCIAMGFEVGTDTFLLCLDNRNILRKSDEAAREAHKAKIRRIFYD
jgi:hypothetical protein